MRWIYICENESLNSSWIKSHQKVKEYFFQYDWISFSLISILTSLLFLAKVIVYFSSTIFCIDSDSSRMGSDMYIGTCRMSLCGRKISPKELAFFILPFDTLLPSDLLIYLFSSSNIFLSSLSMRSYRSKWRGLINFWWWLRHWSGVLFFFKSSDSVQKTLFSLREV